MASKPQTKTSEDFLLKKHMSPRQKISSFWHLVSRERACSLPSTLEGSLLTEQIPLPHTEVSTGLLIHTQIYLYMSVRITIYLRKVSNESKQREKRTQGQGHEGVSYQVKEKPLRKGISKIRIVYYKKGTNREKRLFRNYCQNKKFTRQIEK